MKCVQCKKPALIGNLCLDHYDASVLKPYRVKLPKKRKK